MKLLSIKIASVLLHEHICTIKYDSINGCYSSIGLLSITVATEKSYNLNSYGVAIRQSSNYELQSDKITVIFPGLY